MKQEYRINARAVIYRDGEILGVRHKDLDKGQEMPYWATAGGGVGSGETILEALRRETMEELGVEPKIGRLLFVQHFYDADFDNEKIEFFFLVENADDFQNIDLRKTSHGFEIAEVKFLNPKTVDDFRPKFLQEIDLKDIAENLREVKIYSELER